MKITHQAAKDVLESYATELRELLDVQVSFLTVPPNFMTLRLYIRGKELKIIETQVFRAKSTGELYTSSKLFNVNQTYILNRQNEINNFNKSVHERLPFIKKMVEVYITKQLLYRYEDNGVKKLSLHTFTNREVEVLELEKCNPDEMLNYLIDNGIYEVKKIEKLYESLKVYVQPDAILKILYDLMKE